MLNAVADAVATRAAMLERRVSGDGAPAAAGRGGGGTGHGRKGKPRRWEVMFDKGLTLEAYAQQLDFFGIELGVLRPNNRVEYAFNLARIAPQPPQRCRPIRRHVLPDVETGRFAAGRSDALEPRGHPSRQERDPEVPEAGDGASHLRPGVKQCHRKPRLQRGSAGLRGL